VYDDRSSAAPRMLSTVLDVIEDPDPERRDTRKSLLEQGLDFKRLEYGRQIIGRYTDYPRQQS
jgi:hypothetical protein